MLLCAGLTALNAQTTSSTTPNRAFGYVSLNQDVFFGFYPMIQAVYKVSDNVGVVGYGTLWTTPSFGTGGGGGLWTEAGAGLYLSAFDGKFTITPQIGTLNGKLLSNGNFPMALEGIVPNFTANVSTNRFESEVYAGFYTALRTGKVLNAGGTALVDAASQNNFTHWWANGGVKLGSPFSVGMHYESLGSRPSVGASSGVYKWVGPYFQGNFTPKFSVRFAVGANVQDRPPLDGNDSFYKVTATYRF